MMTAGVHLGVVWMYLTFSSFTGLCLSLWKGHFVEMWYQLASTQAQLGCCVQVVNNLPALLWALCVVLCMCCPIWWFLQAVHHLHFLHQYAPHTKAVIEESGFQLEEQVPGKVPRVF